MDELKLSVWPSIKEGLISWLLSLFDAFRLINPQTMMLGQGPRQTTSNLGHLSKPSIQALIHGLNWLYYSIAMNYRKNELEEKTLFNLHKKKWTDGLTLWHFDTHSKTNEQTVQVGDVKQQLNFVHKAPKKWRFAFVLHGHPEYLQDSDFVSERFQMINSNNEE
ncbi:hypothetical protein JHK86_024531 [Glycine max]|nr:hypothetical protein JHK86_024531 [Glycine max]